jgi:formylglycine-generating enzyme required for sulfatase activity
MDGGPNQAEDDCASRPTRRRGAGGLARLVRAVIWAGGLALCGIAPPALAQSKIALVVGNESYTALDTLPYAARNARQFAQALTTIGFRGVGPAARVDPSLDLSSAGLVEAIRTFDQALERAGDGSVGLLYFAGHGVARARRGDVYLLPIDASLSGGDLNAVGVPLADILQVLRNHRNRTVVIVVDACRKVASADGETVVAGGRGVSGAGWGEGGGGIGLLERGRVGSFSEAAPQGADYFVAFSTSPDRGAYDSDMFSTILSEEVVRGQDLLSLFKRVGERMAAESPASLRQLPTYEVGVYGAPPCFGTCTSSIDLDRFYDCSGCPWMRVVRAGSFTRGSPLSEPGRDNDEPAAAPARVARDFAIGVYEVTRAEWRACERATMCRRLTNRNTWLSDRAPIAGLTRADAAAFLAWLSQQSPARYRLPTEAEWEYAARANTTTPFYFGAAIAPSLAAYDYSASYAGSPRAEYRGAPEAAGAFPANRFGLFDMLGNVWEWTQACAEPGGADCAAWSLRGGSFKSEPKELRAANRFMIRPDDSREDVGLRVARDL